MVQISTGPVSLPFLSSSLTLGRQSKVLGGQHKALCYLSQKYKTNVLGIKLSNSLTVVALSFDTIRTILRGEEYVGRPNNYFVELRSMGTNKGNTHVMSKTTKCGALCSCLHNDDVDFTF